MIAKYTSWADIENSRELPSFIGSDTHHSEMKSIYEEGITLVSGDGQPIGPDDKVLLIYPTNEYATMVEDKRYATLSMAEKLKKVHQHVDIIEIEPSQYDHVISQVVKEAMTYDRIVALTLNAVQHPNQQQLIHQLIETGTPVDVVAIRTPYDAAQFQKANRMICTYEFTQTSFEVVAEYLVGQTQINGRLPVSIT
jgi:beta-N-acetylhexosaminidase